MAKSQLEFEATVSAAKIQALLQQLESGAQGAAKAINDAFGGTVKKTIVFDEVRDERGVKRLIATERERLSIADQIINRQRKIKDLQEGSATSLRQQENRLRQQRDSIARYRDSVGSVGGLLRKQTDEWTAANAQLSTVTRQLALAEASGFWQQLKVATRAQGFINVLNGVNQIVQGLQAATIIIGQFQSAINGVINSAAEVQSFALTFKAIGVGAAGGTAALQEASRISLGLGSDLKTVQDGFRQLSPVVLNIGGSMDDVSVITETLSSRFAAFGISGDRARRVMNGVIQAFAKGKLQAEELTQQISEADPAFKTDLTKALFAARSELGSLGKQVDGSVANLEKLVKAGKITADVLLKVLPGLSKSSLLFGKLGPTASTALAALEKGTVTIDQVRSNINTLNELSLRKFAESATPLINAFLRIQAVTTDFFSRLSQSEGAKAFARLGATAFDIFANLADSLFVVIEGLASVVGAIKPLIDLLTAFPGLLQGIGLLFLGNLIKPLGLFERRIEKTKAAWAGFAGFIGSSIDPVKQEISVITNSIGSFGAELSKSLKQGGAQTGFSDITTAAEQAITSVEGVGNRTANQIDASINELKTKIVGLRQKLAAETAGQETAPEPLAGRSESVLTTLIAQNEARIRELENSAESIRKESTGAINRTAIDIDQLNKVIDEGVNGLSIFGKVRQSALENQPKPFAQRGLEPPFARFSDKALRQYTKKVVDRIATTSKAIASGSIAELGAVTGENLLGKTQKQIDDFIGRVASTTNTLKSNLLDLQAEFQSRGIDFSLDIAGEESVNKNLQSVESQIKSLQDETVFARAELAALTKTGGSDAGKNGFSENETKRQKKLREQIKKSLDQLQGLYAQQAQQVSAGIQVRRRQVGFEPGSADRLQQLVEIQKKADRELYKNQERMFTPEKIIEDRKKLYAELAQIEKNRERDIATFGEQAFPGGYRTEDIERLKKELLDLKEIENDIAIEAQDFANKQNDVNKIFAEGSKEGASFADRQRAIELATRLANTAIVDNNKKIDELKRKYRELGIERKGLIEEQRTSSFVGPVPKDDPILTGLAANKEQSQQTRRQIAALRLENIQAIRKQKELSALQQQNSSISDRQRSSSSRLGNAFRNVLTSGVTIAGQALDGLKNGLKGLAGLIDPLTALLIASGVASRLYAEGNKDASEAAARYADELKVLKQAQLDLIPAQQSAATGLNIFQKASEALAVSTVRIGDAISNVFSGILTEVNFFVEGIKNGLNSAGKEVSVFGNIIGSIGLTSGFTALGAYIGSLFGPGPGTLIGAAIGAAVGVVSSLAIGSDAASNALTKLQKKLDEVRKGSKETTVAVESLAFGLISEIKIPKNGAIAGEDVNRLKAGTEAIKASIEAAKAELTQVRGLRIANDKEREKEKASIESLTKAKEDAEKKAAANPILLGPALYVQSPQQRKAAQEAQDELRKAQDDLQKAKDAVDGYNASNVKLSRTEKQLEEDLKRKENALLAVQQRYKEASKNIAVYANTTNDLNEVIKALNEANTGLNLTDKEDLKTLDENLNKIKAIQAVLELASKTKLEVNIELDKLQSDLRQAQIAIDVPAGPVRDVAQLSEKVNTDIKAASETYAQNLKNVEGLRNGNTKQQLFAAELTKKYSLEYANSIRTAAAELIDKGRQFRDDLESAKNSLQNLKLSNPNFFTPEELAANARQIEDEFIEALEKVRKETGRYNFFPKLEGNTPDEILASKARFNETRKEADKLVKSIEDISTSVDQIVGLLTGLKIKEIEGLKKGGQDINALLKRSGLTLEDISEILDNTGATALPRIGKVVGEISAGGKELVLYFDNVTGKIEEVTAAQFKALQAADKLAKGGKGVGNSFATSGKDATTSLTTLGNRIGKVTGEITAGGKSLVLYYDNLTGKLETVDKATFDRLSKEKTITKEYRNQLDALDAAAALFQTTQATKQDTPISGFIDLSKSISEDQGNAQITAIAKSLGGNFLSVLDNVITTGGVGSFPLGKLNAIQAAVTNYKIAMQAVTISQDQLTAAQSRYNQAISQGQKDTTTLATNVNNAAAALANANLELENAQIGYAGASNLAKGLGVNISSVPPLGQLLEDTGAQPILDQWNALIENIQKIGPQLQRDSFDPLRPVASSAEELQGGVQNASNALTNAEIPASVLSSSLENSAIYAGQISDRINGLNGQTIRLSVTGSALPARWMGGGVTGGTSYQVNELGKEGFLSAAGKLTAINRPAFGTWRAPGSGAVIPAHIMDMLNVPQIGIKANVANTNISQGSNSLQQFARAIWHSMNGKSNSTGDANELARVQAHQANQIGKLSRVVNKLAEKDWNVNVDVRPAGGVNYLNRLNHRL